MAKYDEKSTARLPLIESVIVIAIFMFVSVAILQLFFSADRLQKKSVNVSKATIAAENVAEAVIGGYINIPGYNPINNIPGDASQNENESADVLQKEKTAAVLFFDSNWEPLGDGELHTDGEKPGDGAVFCLKVEVTGSRHGTEGTLSHINISVSDCTVEETDPDRILAEISTSFYRER